MRIPSSVGCVTVSDDEAKKRARDSYMVPSIFHNGTVGIIGAPVIVGQGLRGCDEAPEAVRSSGLQKVIQELGMQCEDYGNICTTFSEKETDVSGDDEYYANDAFSNQAQCAAISERLFTMTRLAASRKEFVLTIGGDHSIACGSISGVRSVYPDLRVIWVDAHGDCNIPENSPSGNYHGMPAAHIMGWFTKKVRGFDFLYREGESKPYFVESSKLCFIALRDLDVGEKLWLKGMNVSCFTMKDIDELGIHNVIMRAIELVSTPGQKSPIHLSLDIDSCDPVVAPGTGTLARGGLTYREAHYICETLAETGRLVGMDLVEINPVLDIAENKGPLHSDSLPISANATPTVRLGLELIASALGNRIL